MDFDKIINFKWGSKPQNKIKRKALLKKWLFIKPDIGNLSSASQSCFNTFTSNPYFGGYPSGNSIYESCAWSTPKKIKDKSLKGFTHFAFSGSGDLKYFYNYFLIKPSINNQIVLSEQYRINGYSIKTEKYSINTIVNRRTIKYEIDSFDDVVIIPGFSGLTIKKYKSNICPYEVNSTNELINIKVKYEYMDLYFTIKILKGHIVSVSSEQIILSNNVSFILSYSKDSIEDSMFQFQLFDEKESFNEWNKVLSIFEIEDNSTFKDLFYTSLYFAIKKPFIYSNDYVYDFATMWDIYKTLLPLIFAFYKDRASIIANYMLKLTNEKGEFYHYIPFLNNYNLTSEQAICIINISLSTAAIYKVDFDIETSKKLQRKEIEYYLNNLDKIERTTHLLDLSDAIVAYKNAYGIDLGLDKVNHFIDDIFDKNKVYLKKDSIFYEGNYSNYSFRVSPSTIYRIKNNKKLLKALDKFFGFKGLNTIKFNIPTNPIIVKNYAKVVKRFEGLNNEPDMESMYLYSYLNRNDRLNKVLHDVMNYSYSIYDDGIPGNDDNGGLSSWLVWNIIGLFPIVGTNIIKIGLPMLKKVKINNLEIITYKENNKSINIDKVVFNDKKLEKYELTIDDIINGGKLEIYLK